MMIKDIRFTGYTTLANCESEPIHVPGTTQPYGMLLAVNSHTFLIDFCSANIVDFWGIDVDQVLGKALDEIIGKQECDKINRHLIEQNPEQFYTLTYRSVCFSTALYQQGEFLLLEIERFPDQSLSLPDLFEQSRNFVSYLEKNTDLRGLGIHVVNEIRAITGYDRVMIYRFDNEYNGEVYAESVGEHVDSFLGLHYPHTDIPPQARALFARNVVRMIPDVQYEPVAVMTLDTTATHRSLDLSASGLRSVSPIHIHYLKTMGVSASLTVSLIHNRKLWGLITCHHNSPKLVPPYIRLATKLHAHFLTSQISNREAARDYEITQRIQEQLAPILSSMAKSTLEHYKNNNQLYACIQADGLAIITEQEIHMAGKTPDKQQITDLISWLATKTDADYYATSRLTGHYPAAISIKDTASGVFFHSLHKASKQGVIWFRGEKKRTIAWAGDPEKAIDLSQNALLPRKSFALWKQVVANTAAPWEKPEIDAGIRLATNIQNNVFLTYITLEEKKYRLQTHQLEKANAELTDFNYICSHDLQEPIRKIQVFSTMLLSPEKSGYGIDQDEVLKKINELAHRAVKQIKDLLSFANLSHQSAELRVVDLDACLDRIKTDLELVITEKRAVFTHPPLGTIIAIPSQMEQLLTNLIGNALKFSQGRNPHIVLSVSQATPLDLKANTPLDTQEKYTRLTISDNGIGFAPEFAEQIFSIFYRLNDSQTYSGSGIGLALCKKIAANYSGHIRATSQPGEGSCFYVYLKQ